MPVVFPAGAGMPDPAGTLAGPVSAGFAGLVGDALAAGLLAGVASGVATPRQVLQTSSDGLAAGVSSPGPCETGVSDAAGADAAGAVGPWVMGKVIISGVVRQYLDTNKGAGKTLLVTGVSSQTWQGTYAVVKPGGT